MYHANKVNAHHQRVFYFILSENRLFQVLTCWCGSKPNFWSDGVDRTRSLKSQSIFITQKFDTITQFKRKYFQLQVMNSLMNSVNKI